MFPLKSSSKNNMIVFIIPRYFIGNYQPGFIFGRIHKYVSEVH